MKKHRIELVIESNDDHEELTDWLQKFIWDNLDNDDGDCYIIFSEEFEEDWNDVE